MEKHHSLSDRAVEANPVETGAYCGHHDGTEDGLAVTLTLLLADVADVDPEEFIDGFESYVDPDALDRLFPEGPPRGGIDHAVLELSIEGYSVSVYPDGFIVIEP